VGAARSALALSASNYFVSPLDNNMARRTNSIAPGSKWRIMDCMACCIDAPDDRNHAKIALSSSHPTKRIETSASYCEENADAQQAYGL
jgi:hypothetical protein